MKNFLIGAALIAAVVLLAWNATTSGPRRGGREASRQEPPAEGQGSPAAPLESVPIAPPQAPAQGPASPRAPAGDNGQPARAAPTGRTVLAAGREDYLFSCDKCNKIFAPTNRSVQSQVRFLWSDPIDCPLCGGRSCAYFAQTCPSCQLTYPQKANSRRDDKTGVIVVTCPRCGIDPTEWIQSIRRARKTSPTDPPRTVLGDRREDFRFLCRQCGANFSPTPESAQRQTRGLKGDAIDCPLCYGRLCAYMAICCPQCKHVYLQEGNSQMVAGVSKVVCPRCKTDPVEWFHNKAAGK